MRGDTISGGRPDSSAIDDWDDEDDDEDVVVVVEVTTAVESPMSSELPAGGGVR